MNTTSIPDTREYELGYCERCGLDVDTPEARAEEDRYGINFWPEGWYSYPYGDEPVCQRVKTVTHWMPLPRLPEIQNGESQ